MQCRTHGQKYLHSLEKLHKEIESALDDRAEINVKFCSRVNKYETERMHLLTKLCDKRTAFVVVEGDEQGCKRLTRDMVRLSQNVPQYMFQRYLNEGRSSVGEAIDFKEKLRQIKSALICETTK